MFIACRRLLPVMVDVHRIGSGLQAFPRGGSCLAATALAAGGGRPPYMCGFAFGIGEVER